MSRSLPVNPQNSQGEGSDSIEKAAVHTPDGFRRNALTSTVVQDGSLPTMTPFPIATSPGPAKALSGSATQSPFSARLKTSIPPPETAATPLRMATDSGQVSSPA